VIAWADYQAAEAGLSALEPVALERLSPRQRQIVLAMAALHAGGRAQVIAAAQAARAAGESDIAWLLELLASGDVRLPVKSQRPGVRDLPGVGEVPEILHTMQSWRWGMAPRGTVGLRRLAAVRPALQGLLDVVGKKKRITWDGLERLSRRAPAALVAAHASVRAPGTDLAAALRRVLPESRLDVTSYHDNRGPFARLRGLQRWVDDPRVTWGREQAMLVASLGSQRREAAGEVLGELLRAVHRRLAAGQGRGLLGPVGACCELARAVTPALVGHLEVLERRLGGLLDPRHHLPPLLTLWRRAMAWAKDERMVIAAHVIEAVAQLLAEDADPPDEMPFVCEALAFLVANTEKLELRVGLLERFGWLLPEARFAGLLAAFEPATRTYLLAQHGFAGPSLEAPLATVIELARMPGADGLTSKLLRDLLRDLPSEPAAPRVYRQLERTLAALAMSRELELLPELLPELLVATRALGAGVDQARALVVQQLARPLADGALAVAEHIVARHLLGDDAGAQEHVRRLGRWLRGADADAADDVALGVLARVYDSSSFAPELQRFVAPLTSFVLREGPTRPLQAAQRAQAIAPGLVHGYGAWAREHIERLGPAPLWRTLMAMADELDELDDEARQDGLENPY
jgi:hypothetical protein